MKRSGFIAKYGLYITWLLACIGTLGSLYFSEIKHIEPCNLCWYQRISLFPLIIILGIATYQGFLGIALYTLPQVLIGFLFAIYQVSIQEIPGWNPIELCGASVSCTEKVLIGLGPITISMLSAFGFFLIGLFLTWVYIAASRHVSRT